MTEHAPPAIWVGPTEELSVREGYASLECIQELRSQSADLTPVAYDPSVEMTQLPPSYEAQQS